MMINLMVLFSAMVCMFGSKPGADEAPVCSRYYSKELKQYVYTNVEVEPRFPGGAAAYQRFLNKNIKYPQEATDAEDLQTSVRMKFIVDTNGVIINPSFPGKTEPGPLDKEFLRLIKLMPKWEPGICQGKAVTTEINRIMIACVRLEMEQ